MATPGTPLLPQFLAGSIMIPRTILQGWLPVINYLTPLTANVLNTELTAIQTQINSLLNATPNPALDPLLIIVPIQLIVNMQNALSVWQYQNGGGLAVLNYTDVVNQIDGAFIQYSRHYYDAAPNSIGYYNY